MPHIESNESVPSGFNAPTTLPESQDQALQWQEANRGWWERHPMRYDWREKIGVEEFSKEFYEEIDRRFFTLSRQFMPWKREPYDQLIDFENLGNKDVLEIGVGSGSHAHLLARYARSFTGIDLTEYAVHSTTLRFERFNLQGHILRMDAEHLEFPDNSFDFIWSWGVIHHSSNTARILQEMYRVLRPGGSAVTMVYHRNFWTYYIVAGLITGVIRGRFLRTRSIHQILQETTDGAIARYYSKPEWREMLSKHFIVDEICVYGNKAEIIPIPGGRFKNAVMAMVPNSLARFVTNTCGWGHFLVSRFTKPSAL